MLVQQQEDEKAKIAAEAAAEAQRAQLLEQQIEQTKIENFNLRNPRTEFGQITLPDGSVINGPILPGTQIKPPTAPEGIEVEQTLEDGRTVKILTPKVMGMVTGEVKKPDMTPEEEFIDLDLRLAKAKNGGTLTDAQVRETRAKSRSEWTKLSQDPEMQEMRTRLLGIQADVAEQRLSLAAKNDMTPAQTALVARLGSAFDGTPIVKKYNTVMEGLSFANSMADDSQNPADNIGLIYAFAKAMDPESVVRESETALIQRYAQSLAETYKFNAQRILTGSEFLGPAAVRSIKATIRQKAAPVQKQYANLKKETARKINEIAGIENGDTYLIDYAAAFGAEPAGGGAAQPQSITLPDGTTLTLQPNGKYR